jgi:putative restriction endonuclease
MGYCYRYRGTDPEHPDNRGLRLAMQRGLPLIYLHGLVPGKYIAEWPVFVVAEDSAGLAVSVAVDDQKHLRLSAGATEGLMPDAEGPARRRYVTSLVRVRLHQQAFRQRVLQAYRRQCAFCRLRHEELLDAAHIIPDSAPEGEPRIPNGLALCSLHQTAFDRSFVGLRPDFVIEVRPDILREQDGPTLVHAIQALHHTRMVLPRSPAHHPDPDPVRQRYERFQLVRQ